MKKNIACFLLAGLATLLLTSCSSTSNQEFELQKKELELKEKELALKEKELSQPVSASDSNTNSSAASTLDKSKPFYVINVAALKTESEAKKKTQSLADKGYEAGYLWIPDYASLSDAEFYSVYIGPYATQYECEVATEEYRQTHPDAYGLLVSQDNKRVQINGIGKVTGTEKSNTTPTTITIEAFSKLPDEFSDMGAGCSYSKTKNGNQVFVEDVMGNAIMKLNGKTVKLTWDKKKNIYVGENFEVSKVTKTIDSGIDYMEEVGHITVKSKDGASAKTKIYGGCMA